MSEITVCVLYGQVGGGSWETSGQYYLIGLIAGMIKLVYGFSVCKSERSGGGGGGGGCWIASMDNGQELFGEDNTTNNRGRAFCDFTIILRQGTGDNSVTEAQF